MRLITPTPKSFTAVYRIPEDEPLEEPKYCMNNQDNAVSELIGAIMMIIVVIAAVSVISVFLLSQTPPQQIPNINFLTGTGNGNLYLFHNGGDPLKAGSFSVLVDGIDTPFEMQDGDWSIGDTVVIRGISSLEHSIQIVYKETNSVIHGATVPSNVQSGYTLSPDVMPVESNTTTLNSCVDIGFQDESCYQFVSHEAILDMFMANVTANYITFYKDFSPGNIIEQNQYIKFKVTGYGSTITTDKGSVEVRSIFPEDVVTITLEKSNHLKTFGLAPAIWELTTDDATLRIVNSTNTFEKTNTGIVHTWITEYDPSTFESTITIHVDRSSNTALTTGNSISKINGVDSREIYLDNVQPLSAGLFLIEVDNSNHNVYFVGNATNIRSNPPL